jgi:predicted transcriptional regulator of viral defense system
VPSPISLDLAGAATLEIGRLAQPIVTDYELGRVLFSLYDKKESAGQKIGRLRKPFPDIGDFRSLARTLLERGILRKSRDFRGNVYNILGKTHSSAEEILCAVDPFAYVSHLSAMSYHGLTNRIPSTIFYSTPQHPKWSGFAMSKMRADLGNQLEAYREGQLPRLAHIRFARIGKQPVHKYASIHAGAFKVVKDRVLRVSTIGRTFLDMVRAAHLCGGINHVIEVYEAHAKQYEQLIVDEVERHGTLIDKTRVGYLLDEKCGITGNPVLEKWAQHVQRGGSRKLDPLAEYSSHYSERWCLSLNNS